MVGEVETRSIRTHTRPRRRAWLIDNDASYDDLLGLIDEMCCVWGGSYTLLVPTDGSSIHPCWLRQLRAFDPDEVVSRLSNGEVSADVEQQIARSCSPFRSIGGHLVLLERERLFEPETPMKTVLLAYDQDWVADIDLQGWPPLGRLFFLSGFGWVGPRLRQVLEDVKQYGAPAAIVGSGEFEVRTVPFTTADRDIQRLLALEESVVEAEPRIDTRLVDGEPPSREALERAELAEVAKRLPMLLTWLGQDMFFLRGIPLHLGGREPSICVLGKKTEDYALAHNLARLGHHTAWLPLSAFPQTQDDWLDRFLVSYFVYKLAHWRGVPLTSMSLSADAVAQMRDKFVDLVSENARWVASEEEQAERREEFRSLLKDRTEYQLPDSVWTTPYVAHFRGTRIHDVLQFVSGLASAPVRVVQPPIRAPTTKYLNWVGEVTIQSYHPPRRSELSPEPRRAQELGLEDLQQECRVSNVGLAFAATRHFDRDPDSPAGLQVQPRIRLLSPIHLFAKALAPAGIGLSPSDKGRFLDLMVRRCGSLDALCGILENPLAGPLLSIFTSQKEPDPSLAWTAVGRRWALTTSSAGGVLRGSLEEVESLLRRLLAESWLELGHALKCEYCLQTDWYRPEEIGNLFRCHRCGEPQPTLPSRDPNAAKGGPETYYRMNELAYQFLSNCGDVTARVLHALSRLDRNFTWMAECNLDFGSEKRWMEVDLLGSMSGELAIGECRKAWPGPGPTASDVLEKAKRLREFVEKVRPDVFIVGSASPVDRQGAAGKFAGIAQESRSEVLVVCPETEGGSIQVVPWER